MNGTNGGHQNHHQQQPSEEGRRGKGGKSGLQWREGMHCLAKYWEDEQHYPARVTALGPNTAVVMFTEFNNYEEVLLEDLLQKPY